MFLDIGQATGLAAASGVRPFLPPILAAALGRADFGVDFSGGDFAFLESIPFIVLLAALAVLAYVMRLPPAAYAAAAVTLGALLFAGSLTEGGGDGWIGLPIGAACAGLGWYASARFFARARARLGREGSVLPAYADMIALAVALVAIAIPPLSFGALAAFVFLIARGRRQDAQKYEGLRILR